MVSLSDILAARRRIAGIALRTPMVPSVLSTGARPVWLKLDCTQPTGAFKIRGAANAVMALPEGTPGVVCCSTGNHGRGVAHAARRRGIRAVVCLSSLVPEVKAQAVAAEGAEVRRIGTSQDHAMAEAARMAAEEGLALISPFDDPHVVAGQGTCGLEMLEDCPEMASLVIPLSGGGLAAGVAVAAKAINPRIRLVGVSMDRGAAMAASIAAGHPVEVEEVESLADSLGGGIRLDNRLTFPLCRDLLDAVVLVTETEIYRGLRCLLREDRILAEGACAVGHAALMAGKLDLPPGPVGFIVTGRSIDPDQAAAVMAGRPVRLGEMEVGP